MDGEQKFLVTVISLGVSLFSLAFIITLLAMWEYRLWVLLGFVGFLAALITAFTVVKICGSFNEQQLRHERIRYHEELPLDEEGMPYYLPKDAQVNPEQAIFRRNHTSYGSYRYDGYEPQQQERGNY